MGMDEKQHRALCVTAVAAVSFGLWQRSICAGVFAACVVLLFSGLVVAVEHYLGKMAYRDGN